MPRRWIEELEVDWVAKYFDRLEENRELIHLGIGTPSFDTPDELKVAAFMGLKEGYTKYTPTAGIKALRVTISERYNRLWGSYVNFENVLVAPGATNGLFLIFYTLLDVGDEVCVFTPGFPTYIQLAKLVGCKPVAIPTMRERSFKPSPDDVADAINEKTKIIVINSPCNPTGAVYDEDVMRRIIDEASKVGAYVVSDEVYENYVYSGQFVSLAKYLNDYERIVIVNSFSKTFAMTGWRVGYVIGDRGLIEDATKLQTYVNACTPSVSQYTALHAILSQDSEIWTQRFRTFCREGRDLVCRLLREAGLEVTVPDGGFYVFPRITIDVGAEEFCERLLNERRVVTIPGDKFGPGGERHFRLTFAVDHEKLIHAGTAIKEFVENWNR
ncbi:MAG: aminotransferase class I/II-fold pyridoxal phosphate-dependent enzyme [Aigarchaeota archaeon]|nr:aminotransferase class I/II-fold pyridoxal phosphate-dependent enzyme [Aigarchaeota archaeon]MDW8092373.1 aminotransferase class I/II-fold pyridoxal phosphate-dependent enzyme [Nitrososphaerota archaeon]